MQNDYKQVLLYGLGTLAVVSGFLLLFFLSWSYEALLPVFKAFNNERSWMFPWNRFSGTYSLNKVHYYFVMAGYFVSFVASTLILWKLKSNDFSALNFTSATLTFFVEKLKKFRIAFAGIEKKLALIFFTLLTAERIYFLFKSRIGLDESLSYMMFLNKKLPGILLYYALPNNHVFYNLLSYPLSLVCSDPYWTMSLPTFFIACTGTILLYIGTRSVFTWPVALLSTILFSFSNISFYYAIHGRGYFLVAVCSILAAISLYKIYTDHNNFYWLIFIVCSIIGFYTVPVYLYAFFALCFWTCIVFIRTNNWAACKQLILSCFFITLTVIILYVPIIMGSGTDLLFFNIYVNNLPVQEFFQRFSFKISYLQGYILGQETLGFYAWIISFFIVTGLLLLRRKASFFYRLMKIEPALLFLIWSMMIMPFILFILQRSDPPERTFFFKSYFDFTAISLLFCFTIQQLFKNNRRTLLIGILGIAAGFIIYESNKFIRSELQQPIYDPGFDARIEELTQTGAKVIFANNMPYSGHLRYALFRKGIQDFIIDEGVPVTNRNYEILILTKDSKPYPGLNFMPEKFTLFFQNDLVHIYILKSLHKTLPKKALHEPLDVSP